MTRDALIAEIRRLAGPRRDESFTFVAEHAIDNDLTSFVETGCYRGDPLHGNSTRIFALLAQYQQGFFTSYDIEPAHIAHADQLTKDCGDAITFVVGDSVDALSRRKAYIDVAYLDAAEWDPDNVRPSQIHQLAEVAAIVGKVLPDGLIVLDDCDLPYGGVSALSTPFLIERGWKLAYSGYQRVFVNS